MTVTEGLALGQRAGKLLTDHVATIPRTGIEAGLTAAEFDGIEQRFGFEFADDHRAFLATVLPVGPRWPDWRHGDETTLRTQLSWPVEGTLFDVEHADVWAAGWGARPASLADALAVAREQLASVPQLVPIYGHRYLPSGRGTAGHPVLSVYQTDIIYYGTNLLDYLYQEFRVGPGIERNDPRWQPRATVPFWLDFIE
jgi:hypothetical protein